MLLNIDRDRNIDFLGKKMSIFCRTHIAVGHRIQGGRPGPLRLPSAADDKIITSSFFTAKSKLYETMKAA